MKFGSRVALSIVACGMLCEGQSYADWNNGQFNGGDTVDISYQFDPLNSSLQPILNGSITLASGTLTANVNIISSTSSCGIVACLNSQTTFGSKSSEIIFNVKGGILPNNPAAFDIQNGGSLTVASNIKVSGTMPASIFRVAGSGNLEFQENVDLSGASTAITMGSGNLNINKAGGKKVDITGAITTNGGTTNIKLDDRDTINGAFSGTNSSTLNLTIDNSTYTGNVTNNGTSNITIQSGGQLQGSLTTSGNSLNLTMNQGTITNGVTSTAGTNTISLTNGSSITAGGLSATGNTNSLTINGTGATITGDVKLTANNGGSNTTSLTNANITGNLTLSGTNQNPITINSSTIGGTVTTNSAANFGTMTGSTIGKMQHTGGAFTATLSNTTINSGITATSNNQNISLTLNQASHINGTSSLNAGTGTNTLILNNSSTAGDITLTSSSTLQTANTVKTNGSSTINKVSTVGAGGLSFLLQGTSSVTNGIHTSAQSTKVDIAAIGNSKINGTSELAGAGEVRVVFKERAGAGTLNFQGTTNDLIARPNNGAQTNSNIDAVTMQGNTNQVLTENNANFTLGSLSMTGGNNNIAETSNGGTNLANDGANLTVTGNASVTATNGGNNKLAFGQGSIGGSLTTQGDTNLYTLNGYRIQGGVIHSDGNFNADLYSTSQISQGIHTSGTGDAVVNLKANSKINGDSNFGSTNNTVNLVDSSQINGNTTFAGTTNTLTANGNTQITGQVISGAQAGTTTHTLEGNATIIGGINTQAGAGKTTANFNGSSKLQDGTSNFHADIDITFADNSKAINEQFNVNGGTANITFQDQAQMERGRITTNNGGTSVINFQDTSKMINGTIETIGGTANLTAQNSAELSDTFTQSGGTFTATFENNSKFNGNATQTGGTSNINFKNNSSWTGKFNQDGGNSSSTIKFDNSAHMQGNIQVDNGTTNIIFNNGTYIKGDIKARGQTNNVTFDTAQLKGNLTLDGLNGINGDSTVNLTDSFVIDNPTTAGATEGNIQGYDKVDITITRTQVDGYLHQGGSYHTQGMKATITDSWIKGGYQGKNSQTNTLDVFNSKINGGIEQIGGILNADIKESIVTDGLKGSGNSQNTVTMNKGSLTGGITQNTGSLTFTSRNTNISGGFHGINSINTLKMANGDFTNGDIKQEGESLQADIVKMTNVKDFLGSNGSQNNVSLMNTQIVNVSQNSGGLNFTTDSDVTGNISGTNGSNNNIRVTGADVTTGKISQNTGSMNLYLTNAKVNNIANDAISATNATLFGLYANTATVQGGITLSSSNTVGVSNELTLQGGLTQTNGQSNLTFAESTFGGDINITNGKASMIFTKSTIQNITSIGNTTSFSLTNTAMENFTGTGGNHSFTLTNSTAKDFGQTNGSLTINANAGSTTQDITSNTATLTVSLNNSTVNGAITNNNGDTTITSQGSTIKGNVSQSGNNNSMSFNANTTTINGQYIQDGGTAMVNFTDSDIEGGIDFENVRSGTLSFDQTSAINNGFSSKNSSFSLMLLGTSTLKGGFNQDGGNVTGTIDGASSIGGDTTGGATTAGLTLENGTTNFTLYNNSSINNGIKAANNTTTILIDGSQIDGNITVERGSLDLTAQNKSTITSNQMKVTNADLKLTLDTNSTFTGNLEQTNNNQTIIIKQGSTFQGDITNNNTTGTITINNATLKGSLKQNGDRLGLDLSNNGVITGDVSLDNTITTLSGSGNGNRIDGNFSQTGGSLNGSMNGLTLGGNYSQENGISDVSFTNSTFNGDVTITTATSSSLSFDNSTLRNYTISGGTNNTLKLLNGTNMNGTLTLNNNAQALLKMDASTITAQNGTAITGNIDSTLSLDTLNSTITGNITFNTGGLNGVADNTKINGNISLTGTTSDVDFINKSSITGDIIATDGDNKIKLDDSSITGSVLQTNGQIDFELSNGSSIGQNLIFTDTTANFHGVGTGNKIDGKIDSIRTNLIGDVSGLTLKGTFTQENGTSNITFRNESNFNGNVSINTATSSNINFENQSGVKANIEVKNGNNNNLSFSTGSYIEGNTTLTNTNTNITASNNSTITGNLTSDNSTANATLDASTFNGEITQTNGVLNLTGANGSTFTSNAFNITGNGNTATTNVNLNTGSNLSGNITATNANLTFSLNNTSSVGAGGAPSNITLTDSTLSITAQNGSTFNANITDTNNTNPLVTKTATIDLQTGSTFNSTLDFTNIDVTASVNGSTLNSDSITATNGKFDLSYTNSPTGGVITKFTATNTDLNIKANNSTAFINELTISGNTLNLLAENNARLTIRNLELNNNTKATYTAQTNGNLNVNTNLKDNGSTLEVNLIGGILQGTITQNKNGNTFNTGNVKLETAGDLGGRLAPTDDMQIHSLTLNNDEQIFQSNALFASVFNNPMSYVDFTLDFDDTETTSRVGKELIVKPQPQPNQPIPPAPNGQTYVRQLQVDSIDGNHGLFRVYADLGANLADNILAKEASGDHIIQVQYRAATFSEAGGNDIVVAKVTDPTTSVSFKGTQSEVGLTRYDTEIIKRNATGGGFEWIIGQITQAGMSYSSKIIATLLQSQYRNFMVEVDSLDRRMGDLRYIKRDLGVWMRAYIGEATKAPNDFSVAAKDNYYSVWAGVDFNSLGLTVHNFAGMFFNYTGINSENKDYVGSGYNIGVGFYDTFKAFSGFYADFLVKYIYSSNSFEISNYALAKNKPELSNHKFLLNVEIGHTFYYGEKFKSGYIEPQFQVTSGYIDQASMEVVDVSGEKIYATMARNFPITMRAGVFWGQVFGEKIKSHIKLGSSFAYDVNSGGDLHFQDSSTQLDFKQEGDFRMLLSAQTDFTFSDFFKLYASIDTSFFGNYNITYSANVGLRMTFGRANNRVANVPMVYNPYEPPVVINDDKRTVPVVKRYTTKDIDQNYVGKNRKVESQIQGNPTPQPRYGAPAYSPSRKSIRDITSEVSF